MRLTTAIILCFISNTFAWAQTHKGISFQGVVKLPTGEYPTRSGLSVTAQILSPNDCVLREERFSSVNLSNGYINLVIGTGTALNYDPGLTLKQVMDNSQIISSLTCLNADGDVNSSVTSFNPATSSGFRKFRVNFKIDSIPVIADFNMRSVAYAVNSEFSDDSKLFAGKPANQYIQTSAQVTQSALEDLLSNTTLGQILSGTLPGGVSSVAGRNGDVTLSASDIADFNSATDARLSANSTVSGAFQSSTSLGGDLSGTLPNPAVVKLRGQTLSTTGSLAGQILRYAGGNTWTPAFISMFDLRSTTTGAQAFGGAGCTAKQTLTWTSATDNLSCTDIAIESSQVSGLVASATTDTTNATNITSGTLNINRLPTSVKNSLWDEGAAGDIYRNSGNVGIGVAPTAKLHVNGEINVSNNKITNVALPTDPSDVATKSYVDASAGGGSSCPVSGGATYFTEGGNPSFCRQSTLSSGGAFIFTNVNNGATCGTGKVCKDGNCTAASACTGSTALGTACGSGGIYAGNYNGSNYMVMPSGCNNSTTPSCGGADTLMLAWATYSGGATNKFNDSDINFKWLCEFRDSRSAAWCECCHLLPKLKLWWLHGLVFTITR